MTKLRVLVLFGGRSGEHEVSLISARSVLSVLDRARYEVIEVGITHEGEWLGGEGALEAFEKGEHSRLEPVTIFPQPGRRGLFALRGDRWVRVSEVDVVFPVLHGTFGEDGTLQGLLEMAEVAYVGAGVVGSAVGMDKGVFKHVMRARGIPVVDWMVVTRREIETQIEEVVARAEALSAYPLFTKPANLGSSVGVTRCQNRADLVRGLREAARYDRRVLIEHGIPQAREIEVSVLGNDQPQASIAGEIIPSREFYSYEAKYLDGTSGLLIPAPLDAEQMARVQQLALEAYRAVDCAGMARVDFLMDRHSGEIYLNEINTIPGFTSISMYPKLWEASGLPYPQLVDRLIELALERQADRQRTERVYRREG
ncbi:MAG: D-alanine--D-alanine ligase family protein [Anaerolineales bacterium]